MEDYFRSDSDESAGMSPGSCYSASDSDDSPDSESSASDSDQAPPDSTVPRRPPGRPCEQVGTEADTARNRQRRIRYKERKKEDLLEAQWRAAVANKRDDEAAELCSKLLETRRGATLFPDQAKTLAELNATKVLANNVSELNKEFRLHCGISSNAQESSSLALTNPTLAHCMIKDLCGSYSLRT